MKKELPFIIALIGFTAMASQIVFVRELLVAFHGNELSIGFILASWLMGGAIGSAILGSVADRIRSKFTVFALYETGIAIILPLNIVAIRSVKGIFNITAGKVLSVPIMASASFVMVVPVCVMLGFLFALACRIYKDESGKKAVGIGRVYVLEAAGSIAGGLLVSFIMVRFMSSIGIMAVLSTLNIAGALLLFLHSESKTAKILFSGIGSVLFAGAMLTWFTGGWSHLNDVSVKREWRDYRLLASKDSIFGNIAVAKREDDISFFENGLLIYTVPDRPMAEENIHFALLEHPDPKRVLLIGGGAGGLLNELLKHPVNKVDYVELDPLIIKLAVSYLPYEYTRPFKNERVSIKNTDGRAFLKGTDEKYDCIIMNVGDPYTAQINRYYTEEFFKEAHKALSPGGIISFSLRSSENYISKDLGEFLKSVYATLKSSFRAVLVIPGDTAYFLASDDDKTLTYDYRILMSRASERKIDIRYVREYYLFSRLSKERTDYITKILQEGKSALINRDFHPVAYYRNAIFLATRFRDSVFSRILRAANEKSIWYVTAFCAVVILIISIAGFRREEILRKASLAALATGGFTNMAYQMVTLLSFQFIYGYLFYKIGIILTIFMVGLAAGGYYAIRRSGPANDSFKLMLIEIAMCVYLAASPLIFRAFSVSQSNAAAWFGSNIVFLLLPLISGFVGGMQFPVAARIYLGESTEVGRAGGISYGIDLFGSSLGALVTGLLLVPILGITKTCLLTAIINGTVILLIFVSRYAKDEL